MDWAYRAGRKIYYFVLIFSLVLAAWLKSEVPSERLSSPETSIARYDVIASEDASKTFNKTQEVTTPQRQPAQKATNELEQALSWNELRRFPNNAYKDFVSQLAQEEFGNGSPFQLAQQRELWQKVLGAGIKDYSRKVYRSPHFHDGAG
ncbi:MAG: hypothetical protein KDD22_05140, partial [Bdellovibrionales bacterium]|nr:hypothetical protein [Bdellovibrionales bacterium]